MGKLKTMFPKEQNPICAILEATNRRRAEKAIAAYDRKIKESLKTKKQTA